MPLIVRGPGVTPNYSTEVVTSHVDLAPTFLQLLGIPLRDDFDGKPIPVAKAALETTEQAKREHSQVEYWGTALTEGIHQVLNIDHNTYKAVRIFGADYSLYYSVWCNNEHELYDMTVRISPFYPLSPKTLKERGERERHGRPNS